MSEPAELHELLDGVVDRESFLSFARALMQDREDEVRKEKESPSSPLTVQVRTVGRTAPSSISWRRR